MIPSFWLAPKRLSSRYSFAAAHRTQERTPERSFQNSILHYPRFRCTPDVLPRVSDSLSAPAMRGVQGSASRVGAAPAETYWVSTMIVRNIHCRSCTSHIKKVLSRLGPAIFYIRVNLLTHTVEVRHQNSISTRELCAALEYAAFDVAFATTKDSSKNLIETLDYSGRCDGWMEAALDRCMSPRTVQAWESHFSTPPELDRKTRHMLYCETCRTKDVIRTVPDAFQESYIYLDQEQRLKPHNIDRCMWDKPRHTQDEPEIDPRIIEEGLTRTGDTPRQYVLTILITGMTCHSCTNSITKAIEEQEQVSKVEVSLLTHSATVEYTGLEDMAAEIVKLIEDVGFEASIGNLKILTESAPISASSNGDSTTRRSMQLSIDGMFCDHCPSRVVSGLTNKYPSLEIEEEPSVKRPVIRLAYTPVPGLLTVRELVSTIDGLHEQFTTRVYHPPSVEDQSQLMQSQERHRLMRRLVVCFAMSIPTLLIGIVWMSLVRSDNPTRMYFETAVWNGTATRGQWALFILATPVMFYAANVFHVRAAKEIRALWRPKSHVPILRRFYRFGSMNLLVSAGTSVAYFSSVGLLIKGATTKTTQSTTMSDRPQYFDAVVFLTFFILLGRFLEAYSKGKTGSAVTKLGSLRPQEAILVLPSSESNDDQSSSVRHSLSTKSQSPLSSITQTISVDLLEIGDVVVVPCGASPPSDATIVSGSSRFNESSLTGESRDVPKIEGDRVLAGTVNTGNPVQVEITGLGGTSMLDQIISVVREGQTKRAPVERIVDTVTGYFVPVITALAIVTFIVWFTLGESGLLSSKYIKHQDGGWAFWSLEFAIAVFVVACPCGIGLAAPTALFVGGGLAAKSGILVRGGGEAFQEASNVDAVVFDKTGTLTEGGNPTVSNHLMLAQHSNEKIAWSITRSLEESSSHPLARAILSLASTQTGVEVTATSITEEAGRGLQGTFTVKASEAHSNSSTTYEAAIGSEDFIASLQEDMLPYDVLTYNNQSSLCIWKSESKSVALLALRKVPYSSTKDSSSTDSSDNNSPWKLAAMFAISDPLRPSAAPTISALQARGIAVYMLTGDNQRTASNIASTLSIPFDHVFASCLPTQKAEKIEWLKENAAFRKSPSSSLVSKLFSSFAWDRKAGTKSNETKRRPVIAFIGDGINDAPALASANVSIAITSSTNPSSDIALSSSSFILLNGSLFTILTLLDLSGLVFRRIKFNFLWAVAYNAILVPVAAGVFFRVKEDGFKLSPAWGSAAMAMSSISVVLASLAMGWGWKKRVARWEKGWMGNVGAQRGGWLRRLFRRR
ncbi:MAG: hypothetical protein Q9213_006460 [Squamulea squamosa]